MKPMVIGVGSGLVDYVESVPMTEAQWNEALMRWANDTTPRNRAERRAAAKRKGRR